MRVRSVTPIKTEEPVAVYDATSPKLHNYTLGNGCVVHNTAKLARVGGANTVQEVLPIRGKLINAARAKPERLSANKEIILILTALAYDPALKEPLKEMRNRNKIFLLADGDPDGQHINLLILTFFAFIAPDILKAGMVYLVNAPEYMVTVEGKRYYGSSPQDIRDRYKIPEKVKFQHIKGWGEVGPEVLQDTAFEPKTRLVTQVTIDNFDEIRSLLGLMSWDIDKRRALIGIDLEGDL